MAKGIFPLYVAATSGLSFRRSLLSKILPMPTAAGITLSDNYLKFAGAALGKGAICTVPLTHQRIHGANRYTGSTQMKRRQAEIMMETGRQLVVHFPHLSNIGVNLVSNAIAVRIAQGADQFPSSLVPSLSRRSVFANRPGANHDFSVLKSSQTSTLRVPLREDCRMTKCIGRRASRHKLATCLPALRPLATGSHDVFRTSP